MILRFFAVKVDKCSSVCQLHVIGILSDADSDFEWSEICEMAAASVEMELWCIFDILQRFMALMLESIE